MRWFCRKNRKDLTDFSRVSSNFGCFLISSVESQIKGGGEVAVKIPFIKLSGFDALTST